jgi:hypothetical protein
VAPCHPKDYINNNPNLNETSNNNTVVADSVSSKEESIDSKDNRISAFTVSDFLGTETEAIDSPIESGTMDPITEETATGGSLNNNDHGADVPVGKLEKKKVRVKRTRGSKNSDSAQKAKLC